MTDTHSQDDFKNAPPRNNPWLEGRLRLLWDHHFADVPQGYPITVQFGIRAQYRFGSIGARNGRCIIQVNRLFADPFVPTFVVDGTLAHELAHYVHGYGSGLPKQHAHPHRGGVVEQELVRRGLGDLDQRAEVWRKAHWEAFYASRCPDLTGRREARQQAEHSRWDTFLLRSGNRTAEELSGRLALLAPCFGYREGRPLPFTVEWLYATSRQHGLSYWFAHQRVVRLHGLLADRRIPGVVVDFEIAYWLARQRAGEAWSAVLAVLRGAGQETIANEALQWRRRSWNTFRERHHPLTKDEG